MPIVIDGWNLIRNSESDIDDVEGDALFSAAMLISYLTGFRRLRRDPIVVVFDSSREFLNIGHKNTPGLTVVAAKDADKYIREYIDRFPQRQRRNLRVVSSDARVYYYAKDAYALPVRSEEFWSG